MVANFEMLPRVTSDCIPFRSGGKLARCGHCYSVQKIPDEQWLKEIQEIYAQYDAHQQSGGAEQVVFDSENKSLVPRSKILIEKFARVTELPYIGSMVDVGCAKGGTLSAFNAVRPRWKLFGLELDDRNLDHLKRIPNYGGYWSWELLDQMDKVDVVTVVHTLEHFASPLEQLRRLRNVIGHGGYLFVQVPNAAANPFDLIVADHLLHFTEDTLTQLVERACFAIRSVSTDWVAKETSLIAFPTNNSGAPYVRTREQFQCDRHVRWLHKVIESARLAASAATGFGLFGSSVSAAWLYGQMAEKVDFFVDEDVSRHGRTHLGRPILSPSAVPPNTTVFMPLIRTIAEEIRDRLSSLSMRLVLPPQMTE